jgi:hypothetical protein
MVGAPAEPTPSGLGSPAQRKAADGQPAVNRLDVSSVGAALTDLVLIHLDHPLWAVREGAAAVLAWLLAHGGSLAARTNAQVSAILTSTNDYPVLADALPPIAGDPPEATGGPGRDQRATTAQAVTRSVVLPQHLGVQRLALQDAGQAFSAGLLLTPLDLGLLLVFFLGRLAGRLPGEIARRDRVLAGPVPGPAASARLRRRGCPWSCCRRRPAVMPPAPPIHVAGRPGGLPGRGTPHENLSALAHL